MKRHKTFLARWYENLEQHIKNQRVLIIYGPRRVGKTTLLEHFLKTTAYKYRLESGDNVQIQELFSSGDFTRILEYVQGYELLAIDEAQQIPNIGKGLKIIVDHAKDLSVIATGSSSFDLSQTVGEPLTGRKKTLTLFPFAHMELIHEFTRTELRERLEDFLIFGAYPDVLQAKSKAEKKEVIQELVDSYLLRDVLALDRLKSPHNLLALLKLLAFQVGQLVSVHEIATQINLNVKTVSRYLDLLEKIFCDSSPWRI